jgi:hypothetical protein
MKTKLKLLHATVAGALVALAGCASCPQRTTAWEYRVVEGWTRQPDRAELEKQLNEAGKEGYVIVSSTTLPGDPNSAPKTIIILKRRGP